MGLGAFIGHLEIDFSIGQVQPRFYPLLIDQNDLKNWLNHEFFKYLGKKSEIRGIKFIYSRSGNDEKKDLYETRKLNYSLENLFDVSSHFIAVQTCKGLPEHCDA